MDRQFLYWYTNGESLQKGVDRAIDRFRLKLEFEPAEILVNPEEVKDYQELDLTLKIVGVKTIAQKYFGLS